jgi:Kef-type K+ transport system membrane component KefB
MKNFKNIFFYILLIGTFSAIIFFVIREGSELENLSNISKNYTDVSSWEIFKTSIHHSLTHPLSILLLQILTIIIVARIFGFICTKIGQPTVIGEIAAGIILGPSLVGMYFPEFSSFLFPKESLGNLQFLSQIGLILFMYVIGMELDLKVLKNKAHDAVVISHASIVIPFALGITLAYFIYEKFAPENINFLSFGLFIGIAMSITAFPVLARIVQERGLTRTKVGTVVITCAAADDITAWCILAAVIAIVKAGSFVSAVYTILLALGYVFIMIKVIAPFLKRLGEVHSNKESLSKSIVAIFFIVLILSSYATEVIGIHALFGAFMAGVIMPSNTNFRSLFIEKLEDVALVLLLPLFFVFTGLRTEIGLLNDISLWEVCGIIILVAVAGKFLGSALSARFVGQNWKDSLTIGALMNTRGLVELVVLNIGYDLGVLTPEVFAMLVIMALVTTCMTGPALDLINKFSAEKSISPLLEDKGKYKILISLGNPQTGKSMLRLANSLINKGKNKASVTVMHFSPSSEVHSFDIDQYEKESFDLVKIEAQTLELPIKTLFKASNDFEKEIIETSNSGQYDLVLIGAGQSVYEGSLLGKLIGTTAKIIRPEKLLGTITGKSRTDTVITGTTEELVKSAKVPVGIFLDKRLSKVEDVFIPLFSRNDAFLIKYAQRLISNNSSRVVLLDMNGFTKQDADLKENIRSIEQIAPNHIALYTEGEVPQQFLKSTDLMLVSLQGWEFLIEQPQRWSFKSFSILIIKDY